MRQRSNLSLLYALTSTPLDEAPRDRFGDFCDETVDSAGAFGRNGPAPRGGA